MKSLELHIRFPYYVSMRYVKCSSAKSTHRAKFYSNVLWKSWIVAVILLSYDELWQTTFPDPIKDLSTVK